MPSWAGAGSFRDAVSVAGRTVVFDVGGYITLSTECAVKSNITIAGQTAPGMGIAIRGAEVTFGNQQNVICRFMRFRPGGDSGSTQNGLSLYQAKNIILDHCSVSFAKWNNIDAVSEDWQNKPVNNISVQHCLIANPIGQVWSGALMLHNALDKEYILAAGSRGAVTVGTPRDWKASVTYKF